MNAPEIRARYVATLRAIADLVEGDEDIPLPSGYLSCFPSGAYAATRIMRATPMRWAADGREDGVYVTLRGNVGDYSSSGIRLNLHLRREDAGTEGEARPVTVTVADFTLAPEIAALLERDGGEAA